MATTFAVDLAFNTKGMAGLTKAQQEMQKVQGGAKGAAQGLKGASTAAGGFGAALSAALGPIAAITAAIGAVTKGFQVMAEREADIKALENGLKKFGDTGGEVLDALQVKADQFGNLTLFSQEDYTKSAAILTSFTNVAIKDYDRLINVAGDVAQVMGTDMKSATTQLAKALNDPTQGLTALTRSGITFSDAQKDMINGMVKAGDLAGAQATIFAELENQYKGAAEAAGTGLAGAWDGLSEAANDAFEALGKLMEPLAGPVLEAATWAIEELSKWWEFLAADIFPRVQEALQPVVDAFQEAFGDTDILGEIINLIQGGLIKALDGVLWVVSNLSKALAVVINAFKAMTDNPVFQFIADQVGRLADFLGLSNNRMTEFRDKEAAAADEADKILAAQTKVAGATEDAAMSAEQLKNAQKEVTKTLQEAGKAADRVAKAEVTALKQKRELIGAELQTKKTLLGLDMERANRALDAARNEQEKIAAARQVYDIAIQQAKVEREIAQAGIDAAVQQAELAVQLAGLKERELQAVVRLAEAQGAATAAHYQALEAQREAVALAEGSLTHVTKIAAEQGKQADAIYNAQVEAAKLAFEQNKVWDATKGAADAAGTLAGNMQQATMQAVAFGDAVVNANGSVTGSRYEVERTLEAMQNLNKETQQWAGAVGTKSQGTWSLDGSQEAIQQALGSSKYGKRDARTGQYTLDVNWLSQQPAFGGASAHNQFRDLQEEVKRIDEGIQRRAEREAREQSYGSRSSQSSQVNINYQGSTLRFNEQDYMNKNDVDGIVSRAVNEVQGKMQGSASFRLQAGLS